MRLKHLLLLSTVLGLAAAPLRAEPVRDQHVEAELLAETASIQPGGTFWVGLKLTMDPEWHTYWKNCGDACQPTSIKWTLPAGFEAGEIVWPHPIRFSADPTIVNYGYKDTTLLLVPIKAPADASGTVELKALAKWLMCSDMCIPGKAQLSLSLPVKAEKPAANEATADVFAKNRAKLAVEVPGWSVTAARDGANLVLKAVPPAGAKEVKGAFFFIEDDAVVKYEGEQTWSRDGDAYKLVVPLATEPTWPERIRGVLVAKEGWNADGTMPAMRVDVTSDGKNATAAAPASSAAKAEAVSAKPAVAAPAGGSSLTLFTGLLAMFLGGMILNLMPCVFPVLSLKIVGFVESAKEGHGSAGRHALAFTAGVMVSMWILAAILLSLRGQGQQVGWAFQMSNPTFVLTLIFLFLLIGLNMFGVFEFGVGLTSAGGELQAKKGLSGSFFSGLLTTVAGAPCAGPFLGSAIGFALSQSPAVAMLGFTMMGLGTAAPYAILSTNPSLLKFVPRPGAWMETMKQLMGFPMVATAAWFAVTFVKLQGGVEALFALLVGCILVAMAAWTYGRWGAFHRSARSRWIATIVSVGLLGWAGVHALEKPPALFEPWSAARVAELHKAGKPVFVDFTAEWCAICQVNKKVAVENKAVLEAFKAKGVTVLIADWTDQNDAVAKGLAEHGRAAVPLYLLYGRDPAKPPEILPQTLTPGLLLDALNKL